MTEEKYIIRYSCSLLTYNFRTYTICVSISIHSVTKSIAKFNHIYQTNSDEEKNPTFRPKNENRRYYENVMIISPQTRACAIAKSSFGHLILCHLIKNRFFSIVISSSIRIHIVSYTTIYLAKMFQKIFCFCSHEKEMCSKTFCMFILNVNCSRRSSFKFVFSFNSDSV